eukprot:1075288-Pyramimonas_sp.AAC.1
MSVRIWKFGILDPTVSASKRAISKRASVWSIRSPAWTRKSMRAVPKFSCLSSSRFSNLVPRRNIIEVAPSVWHPPVFTPKLITAGGRSWQWSFQDLQGHAVGQRPVGRESWCLWSR